MHPTYLTFQAAGNSMDTSTTTKQLDLNQNLTLEAGNGMDGMDNSTTTKRLDLNQIAHCGRTNELAKLRALFDKAKQGTFHGVLVEAPSGFGKSALLEEFVTSTEIQDRALICRGKFEERTAASEPFGAISGATKSLFATIKAENEEGVWSRRVEQAVQFDIDLVGDILPDIRPLFEKETEEQNIAHSTASSIDFEAFGNMSDKEWRFERFRLAFRALLRCVSSHHTVVFVLDDMHWADPDSMGLVRTLLEDTDTQRHLLFIGATRPMKDYKIVADLSVLENLDVVSLQPLTVEDIARLLADALDHRNDDDIFALAEIIENKTGGNTFVLLQFLRLLEEKGLVYYSEEESRWLWDGCLISSEATISDNVVRVVSHKLETMDKGRRSALMAAASFGVSHFDVSTVVHAMSAMANSNVEESDLSDPMLLEEHSQSLRLSLVAAAEEGLVEEIGPEHFRFSHDRIREASYSLLPEGDARKETHLKIGRQLRSWMDEEAELGVGNSLSGEAVLFHATKQLNLGADLMEDTWELLDLADLNYHAAELAAKRASFYPSMEYLQSGLSHLKDDAWENHHSLTMKLTVALTRMQYCCGLFSDCIKSADRVVAHAKNLDDKLPVLHTKFLCLLQQERQEEATSLLLDILDDLGEPFPRRFLIFNVVRGYLRSRRLLRGLSDEDILALPEAEDDKLKYSAPFMERFAELSFLGGNPAYIVMVTTRMIRIMAERGHFSLSGYGLGIWGWLHSQVGDFDKGVRYGRVALRVFDECDDIPKEGFRMKFLFWFFIAHWRLPIRDGLEPMTNALRQMWHLGALDYYHMACYGLHRVQFACGQPLGELSRDCKKYSESLLDFKHLLIWNMNAPLHQAVLNFMGRSKNPEVLIGEHIDVTSLQPEWLRTGNKMALFQGQLFGMIVAYYFHDYVLAEQNANQIRQGLYEDGPELLVPLRLFFTGLVYLARFRSTKKRAYKRKLPPILKKFRMFVNGGAVNCKHMNILLQAELMSVSSATRDTVTDAYNDAIAAAADSGMLPHHALANELAAIYLCSKSEPIRRVRPYVKKALALYAEWEATAKVEDLKARFSEALLV